MADRFEDHRGVIQDLITRRVDSVTEIFTRAGAVRGNHRHDFTTQWVYVVYGKMLFVTLEDDGRHERTEHAGIPHAWRAIEDTLVLVFTRGPRAGENYEADTQRLAVPLL